jgi:hypothetical protein
MRTTLTLEPDVARGLKEKMRRTGQGLKHVVNEAMRRGLGLAPAEEKPPPFTVHAHSFGFKPGVDPDRLNQLLDELDTEDAARKLES